MIEDREYMKRELARIYSPHTREAKSAMKRLREDINGCPELVAALKQTRWNRNRNAYTARQVRLIADFFRQFIKKSRKSLQVSNNCLIFAASISHDWLSGKFS